MAGEKAGSGSGTPSKITADHVREQMTEYLRKKFDKDFVVEKVVRTGNEGFGYNKFVGKAYPREDPSIRFGVSWGMGEYHDNYLSTLWSTQGKLEIAATLKEVYGEDLPLKYLFTLNKSELKRFSHSELIGKYGNEFLLDLAYFVFLDGNLDERREADRSFKVFKKYFIDNNLEMYGFRVYYLKMSSKKKIMEYFFDEEKFKKQLDSERLREQQIFIGKLFLNDRSNVRYADDIVHRFEY